MLARVLGPTAHWRVEWSKSTAHPCVQGPNRRWPEPLLLKCCRRSFTVASQYYQKPTAVDAVVRGKLGLKRQADGLANPKIAPAPGGH